MTSPVAVKLTGEADMPMVMVVFSTLASAIWEAIALLQISS